jgi:broad specificity phosphatase PhoE
MATLTLVRHGQASFLSDNYDRLSELGEEQARLLGDYFARHQTRFTRVLAGPLQRQMRTAEIVYGKVTGAGIEWPEPEEMPDLEEYHAEAFLKTYLPELIHREESIRDLHERFKKSDDLHDKGRAYQKMFEAAVRLWIRGGIQTEGIETLDLFLNRIEGVLTLLRESDRRGEQVIAFTSGGVTGAAVALATGADMEKTIELTWMVRNTGLTEFLYSRDRLTLSAFNRIPHLDDPRLWTYR